MKKQIGFIILTILLIMVIPMVGHALTAVERDDIRVAVNGIVKKPSKPLISYKNTIMIPVKLFVEYLGYDTGEQFFVWDKESSRLTISVENKSIIIFNKKTKAVKFGNTFELKFKPVIYEGNLYLSYDDFCDLLEMIRVWEPNFKTLAICTNKMYFKNKSLLAKIVQTLDSNPRLIVNIKFDYGDESMLFDFKVDNENKLLNGLFTVNKSLENRNVTEKSEIFIKGDNQFVKDYRINKWRLDETGNFEVANSFLKIFSSTYMLKFNDLAYATFTSSEKESNIVFHDNIIFNEYMQKDLGFSTSFLFNFSMIIDSKSFNIKSVTVINASYAGTEIKSGRLDVNFSALGGKIDLVIPENSEFVASNVDDIRKMNAIKKALILFLFDADEDAVDIISKSKDVNELLKTLQKPIIIYIKGEPFTYGPYLSNPLGVGDPNATFYKPDENGKTGLKILIDKKTKNIVIEVTEEDFLEIK